MAMENLDVIYIDDELTMTDIFNQFVNYKFKHWRARSYTNSQELYDKIVANEVSAVVWIVDIMMPQKNGTEIAEIISRECQPGTMILGYTALDSHTLSARTEYKDGLRYFSKIINKQDNFSNLLDYVDVFVKKEIDTSAPLVHDPWAGDFGESVR